jgi:hypothetical protein
VATLAVGNLRHSDTVFINATSTAAPPVLSALSIQPVPGDSAKVATGTTKLIEPRALAADSTPIAGLAVFYESLDPTTATVDRSTGFFRALRPGHVAVVATATAYGVTKSDTLPMRIGYPVNGIRILVIWRRSATGQEVARFEPADITVGPGATILFINTTTSPTDITFDDPSNVAEVPEYCAFAPPLCGAGNIDPWVRDPADQSGLSAYRIRRFPVLGTYAFRSTLSGASGKIVVADVDTAAP